MQFEIEIEKYVPPGDGLGYYQGKTVFVPATAVGDIVRVTSIKEKKQFIIAGLDQVIKASEQRIEAPCPHYDRCGGCSLMHLSMEDQVELKIHMLREILDDHHLLVEPGFVPCPSSFHFRYRTQLKCSRGIVGFSAKNSNEVVEITSCKILSHGILDQIDVVKRLGRMNCDFYFLESSSNGQLALTVADGNNPEPLPGFSSSLVENYGFGEMQLHSDGFAQSNPFVTKLVIDDFLKQITPDSQVCELYAGCGTFSLPIAQKAKKLVGFEINKKAVKTAEGNSTLNNLDNTKFICANLEKPITLPRVDTIVTDPPRKGLNRSLIKAMDQSEAAQIFYISCNPATLARDASILTKEYHFSLKSLTAYDMYCHSTHQECLAVFVR
ncbi:class I SAM-dependent RNA methyltransferase [bacterium]|nr:class I SAM-dependent RNA methyltransferase [bacterium]